MRGFRRWVFGKPTFQEDITHLGLLGGAIGFGAGVVWENRNLTASVASGAWKRINKTRDEHWFEQNPIDYA